MRQNLHVKKITVLPLQITVLKKQFNMSKTQKSIFMQISTGGIFQRSVTGMYTAGHSFHSGLDCGQTFTHPHNNKNQ